MKKLMIAVLMTLLCVVPVLAFSYIKVSATGGDVTELNLVDEITSFRNLDKNNLAGYLKINARNWYGHTLGSVNLKLYNNGNYMDYILVSIRNLDGADIEIDNGKITITAEGNYFIRHVITVFKNGKTYLSAGYGNTLDEVKVEIENGLADVTGTKDGVVFIKAEDMQSNVFAR